MAARASSYGSLATALAGWWLAKAAAMLAGIEGKVPDMFRADSMIWDLLFKLSIVCV